MRLNILNKVHALLRTGGQFIHSEWQFMKSEKLKERIQPWEDAGLSPEEVEDGDYLLDWRSGGRGLRYVHHFTRKNWRPWPRPAGSGSAKRSTRMAQTGYWACTKSGSQYEDKERNRPGLAATLYRHAAGGFWEIHPAGQFQQLCAHVCRDARDT